MDTTMDSDFEVSIHEDSFDDESNHDESIQDDYVEPIWKSKSNSAKKQASYSRKNTDKFLDKEKADQNRELYMDLFDENPDTSVCDNQQFERELFSDFADDDEKKASKKQAARKKKKANENPDFLSKKYKKGIDKKKAKLQEIFEKSSVYRNLQALKDLPLNIEEVDVKGNVVKRYEYYFDFDKDKHNIVEVNNQDSDGASSGDKTPKKKRKANKSKDDESDDIQKTPNTRSRSKMQINKQANKQISNQADKSKTGRSNQKSTQKRKIKDSAEKDNAQSSTKKLKRTNSKPDQPQVDRPTRPVRNVKRKLYVDQDDDSADEDVQKSADADVQKSASKRKRKTVK